LPPQPTTPVVVRQTPEVRQTTPVITPKATPTVTSTPRRKAADILVRHLAVDNPPKRKENTELVKQYQALAGRTTDGKYGMGDAKSLAEAASGGHVPPPPRYWPKTTYAKAVKQYEAWLYTKKAEDPARAGEWAAALATARRYYPS